jgi:hypothetical protein
VHPSLTVKLGIAAFLFAIGAMLILYVAFAKSSFELLIPGLVLVVATGPLIPYYRYKRQSSYVKPTDQEIINEATLIAKLPKESKNAEK